MLRSIPARRELGTERWMEEEEKRYHCPQCGNALFRGAKRCRGCGKQWNWIEGYPAEDLYGRSHGIDTTRRRQRNAKQRA